MEHAVNLNTTNLGSLSILISPHQDALVIIGGTVDLGLLEAIVLLSGTRRRLHSALLLLLHGKLVGHLLAVLSLLWKTLSLVGLARSARTGSILRLGTLTIALYCADAGSSSRPICVLQLSSGALSSNICRIVAAVRRWVSLIRGLLNAVVGKSWLLLDKRLGLHGIRPGIVSTRNLGWPRKTIGQWLGLGVGCRLGAERCRCVARCAHLLNGSSGNTWGWLSHRSSLLRLRLGLGRRLHRRRWWRVPRKGGDLEFR